MINTEVKYFFRGFSSGTGDGSLVSCFYFNNSLSLFLSRTCICWMTARILLQFRGRPIPFRLDDDHGLSISRLGYYVPIFSDPPC